MFRVATLLASLAAFSIARSANAQQQSAQNNWPKWRGPLGTGEATNASPPIKWSEQENIKWKIKLPGRGTATPIVWGDKIFIQTAIATGKKVEPAEQKGAAATGETASAKQSDTKNEAVKKDEAKSDSPTGGGRGQRGGGQGGFGGPGGGRRGGFGRRGAADGNPSIRTAVPRPPDRQNAVAKSRERSVAA